MFPVKLGIFLSIERPLESQSPYEQERMLDYLTSIIRLPAAIENFCRTATNFKDCAIFAPPADLQGEELKEAVEHNKQNMRRQLEAVHTVAHTPKTRRGERAIYEVVDDGQRNFRKFDKNIGAVLAEASAANQKLCEHTDKSVQVIGLINKSFLDYALEYWAGLVKSVA